MVITKRGLVLGATAVAVTAVVVTGAGVHMSGGQAFLQESPKELVDEVWQLIDRNYVDATFNQVDWRSVRQEYLGRAYGSREEAYDAIRDMLEQLNDPYTRFMDPEEFRNMQIDTSGELTGVGIQLAQDEETNELIVVSPIEDTPAFEAGILAQDVIVQIDGQSTEGMDVNQAVNLIRGPVGSQVTLTVRRGEQQLEFPLERAQIEIHPVRYSYQEGTTGGVGYIRLTQFSANAAEEMQAAIQDLESQNVTGYILDLRSNPGGLLYSSIDIARMWLDGGVIVSTVDRQGISDQESASGQALTDKPLVVLVDGGSASASEILSGALQDNDRAVLVGTQTFGKGLVQSVRGLGDGSGLAVTVAKYLTPSGRDINRSGIAPDVIIELTEEQQQQLLDDRTQIGTAADPQYARALQVLTERIAADRQNQRAETVPQPQ
ncbi:MAG: PDZ domain-containing protein [Leptolyngbyaceae cyanobacterium RM2_2_4]|nr:PDZ domain-containing protein [Leptolyngbyaceae cyanobacterium SM1_4_3]NJO52530.1 PDZ domain-containing protein [Leptolyngbyaceae cyanobacterium RM2_2_4]NJO74515.1 PDZ domain-containing protein [Leptolyngbyaceae cyanobacterium RM1_406_9]